VQAARPSRRGAWAARRPCRLVASLCVKSSIWAIVWLAKLDDMTKLGWPGAAAEVHEAALGEQDDLLAVGEDDVVDLRLDLFPLQSSRARRCRSRCRSGRCCRRSPGPSSPPCARGG
jgi:hypothetical protein